MFAILIHSHVLLIHLQMMPTIFVTDVLQPSQLGATLSLKDASLSAQLTVTPLSPLHISQISVSGSVSRLAMLHTIQTIQLPLAQVFGVRIVLEPVSLFVQD